MSAEELRRQLDAQEWRCAYPCSRVHKGEGGPIRQGMALAKAFDNVGIVHHRCALVGFAPPRDEQTPAGSA